MKLFLSVCLRCAPFHYQGHVHYRRQSSDEPAKAQITTWRGRGLVKYIMVEVEVKGSVELVQEADGSYTIHRAHYQPPPPAPDIVRLMLAAKSCGNYIYDTGK